MPAGVYTVSMREAGADPATPPVLSTTVQVGTDSARTVAGVGRFADLGLEVLEDDLALPPSGQARVRVVNHLSSGENLRNHLAPLQQRECTEQCNFPVQSLTFPAATR